MIGIYQILNLVTGKCYVGSSVNIRERWSNHKWELKKGKHPSPKLQHSWDLHGKEPWDFRILQECPEERLDWLEAFWMDSLNSVQNGYNCNIITLEDGEVVRRASEETKAKMRKPKSIEARKKMSLTKIEMMKDPEVREKMGYRKGQPVSEEQKAKMRTKRHSEETRLKMQVSHKNRMTDEIRKAASLKSTGRKVSEETKEKLRVPRSPEQCAKISEALIGRKLSEEHKRKISEISKGRKISGSHKDAVRKAHKGKKRTEEAKEKMRGRVVSEETRKKIGLAAKGRNVGKRYPRKGASSEIV